MKMFNFKRNLSIRESPVEKSYAESPVKRIRISAPIERIERSDATTNLNSTSNLTTSFASPSPPLTPAPPKVEVSLIETLLRRKQELHDKSSALDEQLEKKFNVVKELREKINSGDTKRFVLEDFLSMASNSQIEVRNLLNEIYNPGQDKAKKAESMIAEARQHHARAFEKMTFDMNRLMEAAEVEIERKMKSLTHIIEINRRTIASCKEREKSMPTPEPKVEIETIKERYKKDDPDDDDCIILDENQDRSLDVTNEVEVRSQNRVEQQDVNVSSVTENHSQATADDEQTDIDEPKENEEEEERSFTPCQAQRPA